MTTDTITTGQEIGLAWDIVERALPPGWRIANVLTTIATLAVLWEVDAADRIGLVSATGQGDSFPAALRDLAERLGKTS